MSHKFSHPLSFVSPLFAQSFPNGKHSVDYSLYGVKVTFRVGSVGAARDSDYSLYGVKVTGSSCRLVFYLVL